MIKLWNEMIKLPHRKCGWGSQCYEDLANTQLESHSRKMEEFVP